MKYFVFFSPQNHNYGAFIQNNSSPAGTEIPDNHNYIQVFKMWKGLLAEQQYYFWSFQLLFICGLSIFWKIKLISNGLFSFINCGRHWGSIPEFLCSQTESHWQMHVWIPRKHPDEGRTTVADISSFVVSVDSVKIFASWKLSSSYLTPASQELKHIWNAVCGKL